MKILGKNMANDQCSAAIQQHFSCAKEAVYLPYCACIEQGLMSHQHQPSHHELQQIPFESQFVCVDTMDFFFKFQTRTSSIFAYTFFRKIPRPQREDVDKDVEKKTHTLYSIKNPSLTGIENETWWQSNAYLIFKPPIK